MGFDLSVRSNFAQDYSEWLFRFVSGAWFARLALFVALGFGVWVGSRVFWQLALPDSAESPTATAPGSRQIIERVVQQQWFGSLAAAPTRAEAPSNIRLRGVIAERRAGHGGMAIVSVDGGPDKVFSVGDAVAPGVSLKRVDPDGAVLTRGGREEQVALPKRGKP
jgi:general secretion pathway protein C